MPGRSSTEGGIAAFNVDSGEAWTWKECEHCSAMIAILWEHFAWDDTYSQDTMGEFEPSTIAEARIKVYWQHYWRRRDGSLYPVPSEQGAA